MNTQGPYYGPNGYPPPPPPMNNSFATASFVLGIVGLVCCSPLSVVGLILGIMALLEYNRNPFPNRWAAIAGVVLSTVTLVILVLAIIFGMFEAIMDELYYMF